MVVPKNAGFSETHVALSAHGRVIWQKFRRVLSSRICIAHWLIVGLNNWKSKGIFFGWKFLLNFLVKKLLDLGLANLKIGRLIGFGGKKNIICGKKICSEPRSLAQWPGTGTFSSVLIKKSKIYSLQNALGPRRLHPRPEPKFFPFYTNNPISQLDIDPFWESHHLFTT